MSDVAWGKQDGGMDRARYENLAQEEVLIKYRDDWHREIELLVRAFVPKRDDYLRLAVCLFARRQKNGRLLLWLESPQELRLFGQDIAAACQAVADKIDQATAKALADMNRSSATARPAWPITSSDPVNE